VHVLPNGAPLDAAPLLFKAESWEGLRQQVERHFGESLRFDPSKDWWLTDVNGTRLQSWEDVLALGTSPLLNAVPSGRPFQWGPREVGRRFPVSLADREGVEMETIALHPRIFLIHNLLTEEEALALIERALERTGDNALQASGTGFKAVGQRNLQGQRTSASAFDRESAVAQKVLARAFEVSRIPLQESMADGLQILRYQEGQAYVSHKDWFPADTGGKKQNFNPEVLGGSNRFATVFLYLWSPPSGGYTVFPLARQEPWLEDSAFISTGKNASVAETAMKRAKSFFKKGAWELNLMQQCYTKLAVKPVHLGAALFYHQDPMTGRLLQEAEHGACPSLTGTKWGANLWIWNTARHLTNGQGAEPVLAKFWNHEASGDLDLAWSKDDGANWVHFGTASPQKYLSANTFGGHWWRFTRPGSGEEVQRFTVPNEGSAARFSSQSEVPLPEKEL